MSTAAIKLSVCLITYNRARFLDLLLADLFATHPFPFPFEILICDNASTDNTQDVVAGWQARQPEIRYLRQNFNVGPEHNLATAYRMARGEYCIYLADDDRLIPDAVAEVVAYLDAHPNVAVVHAPWELWDDNEKQTLRLLYTIPEERVFTKQGAIELFNFVLHHNVYPETCVYRTSALHRLHTVPFDIYSPFLILVHTFDYGDIAFLTRPFYRQLMRGVVPKPEEHLGVQWIVSRRDSYAAGYEYLAQRAFRHFGVPHVPGEQVAALQKMVMAYSVGQLANAVRLLLLTKNYRGAYEFTVRQQANGVCGVDLAAERREFLKERASVQALIETFEGISVLDGLLLYNLANVALIQEIALELRPKLTLPAIGPADLPAIGGVERKMVLVANEADRTRLIEAGFVPGLVMLEADLIRLFDL